MSAENTPRVKTNRRGRGKNKSNAQNADEVLPQNIDRTFEKEPLLDQVAQEDSAPAPDIVKPVVESPYSSDEEFHELVDPIQSDRTIVSIQENDASEAADVSAKPVSAFSQQSNDMLKQIFAENAKLAEEVRALKDFVASNIKNVESQPNAIDAQEAITRDAKVNERVKKKQKSKSAKAGKGGRDWREIKKENEYLRAELDSIRGYLSSIASSSVMYHPYPAAVYPDGFYDSCETPVVNPDGSFIYRGVTYYQPFHVDKPPEHPERQGIEAASCILSREEEVDKTMSAPSFDLKDPESFPALSLKSGQVK